MNLSTPQDGFFMRQALELAHSAAEVDEVPVGAVVVYQDRVISEAYNLRESTNIATRHAEVIAIEEACRRLGRWRLTGCTLYVTLEPCAMCAGAIVNSRLDRVVYGALDAKAGAVKSLYELLGDTRLNHRPQVTGGVMAEECGSLLSQFFQARRQ